MLYSTLTIDYVMGVRSRHLQEVKLYFEADHYSEGAKDLQMIFKLATGKQGFILLRTNVKSVRQTFSRPPVNPKASFL